MNEASANPEDTDDPRDQELLWPARQHPDDLVLFDLYATRFPGTWVGVVEDSIPADQRHALFMEGYRMARIRLLPDARAQVVVREEPRPDREGDPDHDATRERYDQYDPRAGGDD